MHYKTDFPNNPILVDPPCDAKLHFTVMIYGVHDINIQFNFVMGMLPTHL